MPDSASRAVNNLRPVVRRQMGNNICRQHIPAIGRLVFQYSVIKEIYRNAVANPYQRAVRFFLLRQRLPCLHKIDMPRKVGKPHRFPDISSLVKKRLAEICKAEPPVQTGNIFTLSVFVSFGDSAQTFSGDFTSYRGFHLNKNKSATLIIGFVQLENRMSG